MIVTLEHEPKPYTDGILPRDDPRRLERGSWLVYQCIGGYVTHPSKPGVETYEFSNDTDAIVFKLTFADQT